GGVPTSLDAHNLGYTTRAVLDLPVRPWLRLDTGIDYEGSRYAQSRAGVARPPVGGATGTSVGGFGEQTGSFSGSASGYAAESMTVYPNTLAPFLAADLSFFHKRLTITPQLRLQLISFAGYPGTPDSFTHTYVTLDPRLSWRLRVTERVALKGAIGLY